MPNLDIIYDVITEVTWDERKTNKQVIYQTTSPPSFVTFDAFYFCLWPKTVSFERHLGEKALATDHRDSLSQVATHNITLESFALKLSVFLFFNFIPLQIALVLFFFKQIALNSGNEHPK